MTTTAYPKQTDWLTSDTRCDDLDAMHQIADSPALTYDACDHLADHIRETMTDGRRIWELDGWTVATLVEVHMRSGAVGFIHDMHELHA